MASTVTPPVAPAGKSPSEKIADAESNGVAQGVTPKKAEKKAPKWDASIVSAVRYARMELHARRPGQKDGVRPAASSAGDHIHVRQVVSEMVGAPVTVEKIVKASGVGSLAALRRVAEFDASSGDDLVKLRTLGKRFAKDRNASWRTGRYLSGILVAWAEEIRAASKPPKKS